MKLVDLTGLRFGRLVVLERAENYVVDTLAPHGGATRHTQTRWRCRCDCGNEANVVACALRSGRTRSCGCYRREAVRERNMRRVRHE